MVDATETLPTDQGYIDALNYAIKYLQAQAEPAEGELLEQIYAEADCQIPYYTYGDNEVACDMASRLNRIRELCATPNP